MLFELIVFVTSDKIREVNTKVYVLSYWNCNYGSQPSVLYFCVCVSHVYGI